MKKNSKIGFIALALVMGLLVYNCTNSNNNNNISRVTQFTYEGYDDDIYAVIEGEVYTVKRSNNKNDTIPLSNVEIKAEQNNKKVSTNATGEFSIRLEKGTFDLTITKQGYQSLKITNYISDPDQVSLAEIILEKGTGMQKFEIPERQSK